MKAAMARRYGPADVVAIEEVPTPVPGPGEVGVRVEAAGVTTADWRLRAAAFPGISAVIGRAMFGLWRPRQPVRGTDFAGRVTTLGAGVTRFAIGDPVVGTVPGGGAHAETLVIPESGVIVQRPASLSAAEAAALPFGGMTAHTFLHEFARLAAGQRVLILGASGAVGSLAVQLAAAQGAQVTAVAGPAAQARMRSLGAVEAMDYTRGPIRPAQAPFDLIFDTAGVMRFTEAARLLAPGGLFLPLEFGFGDALRALWQRVRGGKRIALHVSQERRETLEALLQAVARGTLRPAIGARFPFERIVDAYRLVEIRHAGGAVVVEMGVPVQAAGAPAAA